MKSETQDIALLKEAKNYLDNLSSQKLQVAIDFLADLQQKEEEEATEELLSIPNFEQELQEAEAEAKAGEVVSWKDIRRNV
ncbi:hypothetical protein IQ255_27235 [Pleurocapsales cyanobacterium LEGE 10410]|nr:hypothetical protein [Pleurocapsales cyanobacterium LEGE 10410]